MPPPSAPSDRRASLVEVTIPLLREHGTALTTKQVAEAAGIAEGTVFRAFGTKDELVHACVAAVFDSTPAVAELRGIDSTLTLDERLVAGVGVMQRHVERIVGLMSVLHHAGAPAPVDHKRRRASSDPADRRHLHRPRRRRRGIPAQARPRGDRRCSSCSPCPASTR